MTNKFIARKGLISLEDSSISGSLAVQNDVTASFFTGSFIGDGSQLTNLPGDGNLVPYSGAVANVDLGNFKLTADSLRLDPTPNTIPTDQGSLYWDVDDNVVAVVLNGTVQKVGEDSFFAVENTTGTTIPKGTNVRFAGTLGASGKLLIAPFIADGSVSSSFYMGVTSEDIPNDAAGKVYQFGRIRGIDTSMYSEGDILYASTTAAGGFQTTIPTAPNNIIQVAAVITSHANVGTIMVRPTIGSNIKTDEGVRIISGSTGDILQLQSNGLFENITKAEYLGGTSSQFVKGDGSLDSTAYKPTFSENTAFNKDFGTTAGTVAQGNDSRFHDPVTIATANGLSISTQALSLALASTSTTGALSSTDWNTFNNKQNNLGFTPENTANKGQANGYASLDGSGKVPASELPSYVDDVLEFANLAAFPTTGETGKIYIAIDSNKTYRWTGSIYVEVSPSIGTDLSYNSSTRVLSSSTGTDVTLPEVSTTLAGLMSATDKVKLNGVADNANNYVHPNHTGDVTSSGDGATTIANDAVTNSKLANMAVNTIKGRITAGTGDPEDLTAANVRSILNVADGANNFVHPAYTPITQTLSTATVLATFSSDSIGSVTGFTTRTLTPADIGAAPAVAGGYLPLSGGTLTGALNGTSASFSGTLSAGIFNQNTPVLFSTDGTSNSPSLTIFKNTSLSNIDVLRVQSFLGDSGVVTVASINSSGAATFSSSVTSTGLIVNGTEFYYAPANYASGGFSRLLGRNASTGRIEGMSAADMQAFIGLSSYVSGSGTTNFLPKFTGTSTIGNSLVFDNGTSVGINNTTPNAGYQLDVTGFIRGTGYGVFSNSLNVGFLLRHSDWTGVAGSNNLAIASNQGDLTFFTNGSATERLRITSAGDVGIGTTSPNQRLEISQAAGQGTTPPTLRITNTSFYGSTGTLNVPHGAIEFYQEENSGNYPAVSAAIKTINQSPFGVAHDLAFYTNPNLATPVERLRITSAGNVGIGTTAPDQKLTIQGGVNNVWSFSTNTSDQPGFVAANNTTFGTATNILYLKQYGSGIAGNIFGNSIASKSIVASDGSASTGLIVGTFNAQPLIIGTNNSERMRISEAGNVGIGTTAPEQKLHVVGNIQTNDTNGLTWAYGDGNFYNSITNAYNTTDGIIYRSGRWTSGNIIAHSFETGGNNIKRLVINNIGNIGIGLSEPGRKLHLTGGDFYTPDKSDTIGGSVGYGGSSFQIRNGSTSEDLNFDVFNRSISTWYTPMVIKNTGNVGIGTDSPSTLVQAVNDTNNSSTFSSRWNASGFWSQLEVRNYSSNLNNQNDPQFRLMHNFNDGVNNGYLGFHRGSDLNGGFLSLGSNGTERLRITSTGNVLIGTTSDNGARLQVSGRLQVVSGFTDQIRFGTNTSVYTNISMGTGFTVFDSIGGDTAAYDFRDDGQSRLFITSTGNVGIGTSSPASLLTINGTSANTESGQIRIIKTGANEQTLHIGYNTTSDYAYLNAYKAGLGYKPIALNPDGGNVLIGTTNDVGAKLYVDGGIRTAGAFIGAGLLEFVGAWSASPYNGSSWIRAANGVGLFLVNNAITRWAGFTPSSDFDINSGAFWVKSSNSNVGMGTNNPLGIINNSGLQIARGGHTTLLIGDGTSNGGVVQSSDGTRRVFIGANIYDDEINSWQQFTGTAGYAAFDAIGGDTNALARILVGSPANAGYNADNIFFEAYKDNSSSYVKLRTNTDNVLYLTNGGNVGIGTTVPGQKLTVNGNVSATGRISYSVAFSSYTPDGLFSANALPGTITTPSGVNRIRFGYLDQGGGQYWGRIGFVGNTNWSFGTSQGGHSFSIGRDFSGNDLLITNTGNVLIGTTSEAAFSGTNGIIVRRPNAAISLSSADNASGSWLMYRVDSDSTLRWYNGSDRMTLTSAGALSVTGDVVAFSSSDKRLKNNIVKIDNSLEKITKLSGYSFDWNEKQDTYTGHDYGVIAQEVEALFPEMVQTRDNGMKAVKYDRLIPVLIEAIKELNKENIAIKELLAKIGHTL